MYEVIFKNECEIRMGSPFNTTEVVITGNYIPDMKGFSFQDRYALSDDKKECILVQWETIYNQPCFILWKINEENKNTIKSSRILGCCVDILYSKEFVIAKIWEYNSTIKQSTVYEKYITF